MPSAADSSSPLDLWLPAPESRDSTQWGAHSILYVVFGVLFGFLGLLLFVFDLVIALVVGTSGFREAFDAVAAVQVLGYGLALTFIGVLWPLGMFSQAALCFELARRSRLAPDRRVRLASVSGLGSRGVTLDVLVPTPYSDRCNAIGDVGWLPNWRILLGAWALAVIAPLVGQARHAGSSVAIAVVSVIGLLVVAVGFLVWGIRIRYRKLAEAAAKRERQKVNARRADKRDETRRARLTPEERAAEDAEFAATSERIRKSIS